MKKIYSRVGRLGLYSLMLLLYSVPLYGQSPWPVEYKQPDKPTDKNTQGKITGTVGEYRQSKGKAEMRLHKGIDVTSSHRSRKVYAIDSGKVKVNTGNKGFYDSYIKIGNISYFHVDGKDGLDQNDKVQAGDVIGEMIVDPDQHVHMQNDSTNENYLIDGFGRAGFQFLDSVKPKIEKITFHKKGTHTRLTKEDDEFKATVRIPDKPDPAKVIYGKVDIVANAWDPRVSGTGGSTREPNKNAPYSLGYGVFDGATEAKAMDTTIEFSKWPGNGAAPTTAKGHAAILHSKKSSMKNPYWTVTNTCKDGKVSDEFWDTEEHTDGIYEVKVEAKDVKGGTTDTSAFVAIDNFKEFVKDVKVWVVATGELVYDAGWVRNPTTKVIEFSERVNQTVPGAGNLKIQALASEKIKSLSLEFSNASYPARKDFGGVIWEFQVPIPANPEPLEQLKFIGLTLESKPIFSLGPDDTQASVGRDENGNFPGETSGNPGGRVAATGEDTRHSLQFCASSNTNIDFSIDIKNNTTVYINATGGEVPYEYAIDNKPFGPNPTFSGLKSGQQYTFVVKDKNGCKKEKQFVMKNADCDTESSSGGQGTFNQVHQLGKSSGTVVVSWEMYSIPDQLNLIYNGQVVASTGGLVSGRGSRTFNYNPKPGEPDFCIVQMVAPNNGTAWDYTIECPAGGDDNLRIASTEPLYTVHHATSGRTASLRFEPTRKENRDYYLLRYRYQGSDEWQEISPVTLPYVLTGLEAGREVSTELLPVTTPPGTAADFAVFPNPSAGAFTIRFNAQSNAPVLVRVTDLRGREVYRLTANATEGSNRLSITMPNGNQGLYMLNFQQGETHQIRKVEILR